MSRNFELDVLVHGSKARVYKHEGRVFVEGKVGSEFTINVRNNTNKRVLAVLTVDGLSVMDGKEASFKSGGYVIAPWGSIKVPGWRLNDKEIAAFEFTYPGNSYASSKGKGKNLGVIGCAFYYEKDPVIFTLTTSHSGDLPIPYPKQPNTWPEKRPWQFEDDKGNRLTADWTVQDHESERGGNMYSLSQAGSAKYLRSVKSSANNSSVDSLLSTSGLGTGFGDKQTHRVNEVDFDVASDTPVEVISIEYDTKAGLKRRGIDVDWRPEVAPNPFPKEKRSKDYCEPPRGWQG